MTECCERKVNQLLARTLFYVLNVIRDPNSFQYNRKALQTALQTALQAHRNAFPWTTSWYTSTRCLTGFATQGQSHACSARGNERTVRLRTYPNNLIT